MMALMSKKLEFIFVALAMTQMVVHSFSMGPSVRRGSRLQTRSPHYVNADRSRLSMKRAASAPGSSLEEGLGWKSVVSTNADLNEAVDEIVASVSLNNEGNMSKYNLAIFFTSSIYEASAFKYDELFDTLSKKMPGMKTMIGCTTGKPLHGHRRQNAPICRKFCLNRRSIKCQSSFESWDFWEHV